METERETEREYAAPPVSSSEPAPCLKKCSASLGVTTGWRWTTLTMRPIGAATRPSAKTGTTLTATASIGSKSAPSFFDLVEPRFVLRGRQGTALAEQARLELTAVGAPALQTRMSLSVRPPRSCNESSPDTLRVVRLEAAPFHLQRDGLQALDTHPARAPTTGRVQVLVLRCEPLPRGLALAVALSAVAVERAGPTQRAPVPRLLWVQHAWVAVGLNKSWRETQSR